MKLKLYNSEIITQIDPEDYDMLSEYHWYPNKLNGGAYGKKKGVTVWMHRLVMNAPKGMVVDHINHNRLDNRKSNLRICTIAENNYNRKLSPRSSSGYKGVNKTNREGVWKATISVKRKQITLGYFKDKADAARCYDDAAVKHFGEFAHTNF